MNELFDKINNIKFDLSDYDVEELDDIENKKIKNRLKKKIKKGHNGILKSPINKVIAVALCVLISPVVVTGAKGTIDAIGKSIESLSYNKIEEGKLQDYKDIVNQSITKGDYTIKINEFMFDTDCIRISSSVQKNDGEIDFIKQEGFENYRDQSVGVSQVFVNDTEVTKGGGNSTESIDNSTYNVLSNIYYHDNVDFSGDVKVKVVYTDFSKTSMEDDTTWTFEFMANADKMKNDIKIISLNRDILVDGKKQMNLEEVRISPATIVINGTVDDEDAELISYEVKDDLGNNIADDLTCLENSYKLSFKFSAPDKEAKKIIITPKLKSKDTGEFTLLEDQKIEIEI